MRDSYTHIIYTLSKISSDFSINLFSFLIFVEWYNSVFVIFPQQMAAIFGYPDNILLNTYLIHKSRNHIYVWTTFRAFRWIAVCSIDYMSFNGLLPVWLFMIKFIIRSFDWVMYYILLDIIIFLLTPDYMIMIATMPSEYISGFFWFFGNSSF